MSDFFREVDEDVRRQRIIDFLGRYRFLLAGVILFVIFGAVAWRVTMSHRLAEAEATGAHYQAALDLAQAGDQTKALAALKALGENAPKGYEALAQLRSIDAEVTKDPLAATGAYMAFAEDQKLPQSLRDIARVRALYLQADQLDPNQFEERAASLAKGDFAFRNSARELLALAALKRKDFDAAGRWLDQIVVDPGAPAAMRQRASAFLGLVQAGKPAPEPKPVPQSKPSGETKPPAEPQSTPKVESTVEPKAAIEPKAVDETKSATEPASDNTAPVNKDEPSSDVQSQPEGEAAKASSEQPATGTEAPSGNVDKPAEASGAQQEQTNPEAPKP
ncbi:tetratricopeptide repeat protein [Beijerinckia mobilis]|uniref:tetratricopeptide repeat protein n=1 Tax=Beijerinckia mobilis TaxID=231434 RepID=UPI0009FBAFFB|nr:tetratricopeptide repeat protein [Beijerinckia mobilis]